MITEKQKREHLKLIKMSYKISVIKGDGIGPEVINIALQVLQRLEKISPINFEFNEYEAGYMCLKKYGEALPHETIDGIKNSDALLLGAIGGSVAKVILPIRQGFDLFANIRPIKSYINDVDFVIFRENTEGIYLSEGIREHDRAVDTRVITKKASKRITKLACDYAISHNLNKITVVDKANVLVSCELFRETALETISNYPIQAETMYVDNAAMQIVMKPKQFQVILTTNLFGDILSDLAASLIGGLGVAPSANIGEKFGMFEPVHGSAPDITGKGIANPIGSVLSAKMMLEYLGETNIAKIIEDAVRETLKKNLTGTVDISSSIMDELRNP